MIYMQDGKAQIGEPIIAWLIDEGSVRAYTIMDLGRTYVGHRGPDNLFYVGGEVFTNLSQIYFDTSLLISGS